MESLWLFNLAATVFVLRYFRVLNLANSLIYVVGVLILASLAPKESEILPGAALAISTLLFSGYLFLYSVIDHAKHFQVTAKNISFERLRYQYLNPFEAMFLMSLILSTISIKGKFNFIAALILMLISAGAVKEYAFKKSRLLRQITIGRLFISCALVAAMLNRYSDIIIALYASGIYLLLLSAYHLIRGTFIRPYAINKLIPGMLPAEAVKKKDGQYQRQSAFFSIYAAFYSNALNKYSKAEELISPFKSLTQESISGLKKAKHISGIDNILIQKTVDFRIFLILGLVATYFYISLF